MMRRVSLLGVMVSLAVVAQAPDAAKKVEYVDRAEVTPHGLAPGMKVNEIGANTRTFQITFAKGDEVASGLLDFAEKNHLKNSHFTAVGAFDHAVLGWYDLKQRAHKKIPIDEEMEVASFVGNVTLDSKGKPVVHAHCVVGLSDGRAMAGHFVSGHVSLVMQVYLVDSEPIAAGK
jgi:predicted DNA-binding protein with PD1-like motif